MTIDDLAKTIAAGFRAMKNEFQAQRVAVRQTQEAVVEYSRHVEERHALFSDSLEDAKLNLEQVKRIKPDSYEAFLLESEINLHEGHTDAAKSILLSLTSDLGAPDWIRAMAETLMKTIQ